MEDRRRASFLWRNSAYILMFCGAVFSQRVLAQVRFTVVAKTGEVAPGLNETFGDVGGPLMNNAGEVVFTGKGLSYDASSGTPIGVYVGRPGNVQLVTKVGDPAPGSGANVSLLSISPLAFSDNGQVVIGGYLEGPGIARLSVYGLWIGSAHQPLAYVAQLNAPAPGFDSPVNYYSLGQSQLASGRILFPSHLKGGQPGDPAPALWSGSGAN